MKIKKLNKLMENQYKYSKYKIIETYHKIIINGVVTNYSISNLGNVVNDKTSKVLKSSYTSTGHTTVNIYINGKSYKLLIHRLVAEYFCDYRDEKHHVEVHHINRKRDENFFWNLIWVSKKEHLKIHKNIAYYNPKHDEDHPFTTVPNEVIINILNDMVNGLRNKEISEKYNISESYVSSIRSKKKRTHISKNFDVKQTKVIKNRIDGLYDEDKLETVAKLILKGYNNTEIQNLTGIKRDTVSLIRNGRQHKNIYEKYKLADSKKLVKRNSDEKLDEMTKLILFTDKSNKEISELTSISYASVSDARLKIKKGEYKRALKYQ